MIHTILTSVDDNSIHEAKAVIIQLIDWQGAFDLQCHKLGVKAFIEQAGTELCHCAKLSSSWPQAKSASDWPKQLSWSWIELC